MRTGSPVELVLIVPGLLGPAAAGSGGPEAARALVGGLDLDALDRLLDRARHVPGPNADGSLEALAFRAFGHAAPDAGTDWPAAAFTALVDHEAMEGSRFRLRADPVHLRTGIDDLVLFDAADIDVTRCEAEELARTVNDALGPGGPCIDAAHPHRWYVALDAPVRIATTPLSRVAGAGVSGALPRGPDAAWWHRWMNEVQMALHECPVNVERGAPPCGARQQRLGMGRGEPPPGRRRPGAVRPGVGRRRPAVRTGAPLRRRARPGAGRRAGVAGRRPAPRRASGRLRRTVPGGAARGRGRVA